MKKIGFNTVETWKTHKYHEERKQVKLMSTPKWTPGTAIPPDKDGKTWKYQETAHKCRICMGPVFRKVAKWHCYQCGETKVI